MAFGDPDVYVTLDGSVPTRSNYQRRSINSIGNDYILLNLTDTVGGGV